MLSSTTTSLLTTILLFTNALTPVAADPPGINCKGNSNCALVGLGIGNVPQYFLDNMKNENETRTFQPGEQLNCTQYLGPSSLCLFTQNTVEKQSVATIRTVLQDLINHGCKGCGSAPLDRSLRDDGSGKSKNDITTGELTINVVYNGKKRAEGWSA